MSGGCQKFEVEVGGLRKAWNIFLVRDRVYMECMAEVMSMPAYRQPPHRCMHVGSGLAQRLRLDAATSYSPKIQRKTKQPGGYRKIGSTT